MFTGIIEEIGHIKSVIRGAASASVLIQAEKVLEGTREGDSIAVNGVCLTVTSVGKSEFAADVMHETLRRSSLGKLSAGQRVNLERAVPVNGRLGGHILSGHIDGTGVITEIKRDDNAVWFTVAAPQKVLHYMVEKGSIAIDGISLTVAHVSDQDFSVSVIPHTRQKTVLSDKKCGDTVNLENDCIGKYVQKFLSELPSGDDDRRQSGCSGLTREFLLKNGF